MVAFVAASVLRSLRRQAENEIVFGVKRRDIGRVGVGYLRDRGMFTSGLDEVVDGWPIMHARLRSE